MKDDEPARPLTHQEIHARRPDAASAAWPVDAHVVLGSYVIESATLQSPEVKARVTPLEQAGRTGPRYRIDVELHGARGPFAHTLPPIETHRATLEGLPPRLERVGQGFRPLFHELRAVPERFQAPHSRDWQFLDLVPKASARYQFNDRSFPWCTFGRVSAQTYSPDPASSWHGTGVMIGPRHVLMSNRIVRWNREGGDAGWVTFTPAYFHGQAPFGTAYAEKVVYWRQLVDPTPPVRDEHLHALDYSVCILNRRIGDLTGWVGWQDTYNAAWNSMPWWSMVGYSKDFANGEVPVFQDQVRVLDARKPAGTDPPGQALVLENNARGGPPLFWEVGGPVFGWWHPPEPWPRVVGVHVGSTGPKTPITEPIDWGTSLAAGGLALSWLIQQARAAFP